MALGLSPALAETPQVVRPPHVDQTLIHADPAVLRGTLPNGLRYAIAHNATPAGAVSIRLVIQAGLYDEEDDGVEAAHLVEHMAFRNPLTLAGQDIAKTFETMGVGFGRDQNAATGLYDTTYRLDLPRNDGPMLDLSFHWLRDVGDGINFNPREVLAERSVILAERQSHLGPETSAREQMTAFLAPGLRSVERERLETPQAIGALDAARLEAFYQRWYRPENAILVVAGDLPTDEILKRIRDSFGSWRGLGLPGRRRPFGAPDPHRGLDVLPLPLEGFSDNQIRVCRAAPGDANDPEDMARLRKASARSIWDTVLDHRLDALANGPKAPFLSASVWSESLKELRASCVEADFAGDGWAAALVAVETEIERMELYGPSLTELDAAIKEQRSYLRSGVLGLSTRASSDLAQDIADALTVGDMVKSPGETFRAYDTAVEGMMPDDVKASFSKDWSGAGPLVVVLDPKPPAAEEVRRVWAADKAAPAPAPPQDPATPIWPYDNFGKPGAVTSREDFPKQGFVRFRFANGVVLNFKQTSFEADSISVRVRFGAGRREVARSDYLATSLGAQMFAYGGLAKTSHADLVRIFRDTEWAANLTVGDKAFILSAKTGSRGLRDELEILTAFVSDPGFRPDVEQTIKAGLDAVYRGYRTDLTLTVAQALAAAIDPSSPQVLPSRDKLEALSMADFGRLLKPPLTTAPLDVAIVGDVDEKTAVDMVAKTFGALPARSSASRERADAWFQRFPASPPPVIHATHEGSRDRALVTAIWPLYVATPARRREEIALDLLNQVFNDLLRRRVRVELGKAYGPSVRIRMPDDADQGQMTAVVETTPADVDAVLAEIRALARRLAAGDLPDDVVETARAPLVAASLAQMKTNAFWASNLSGSATRDPQLADMFSTIDLEQAVTPDEVRKAAKVWLSSDPIVGISTPASQATAAAGARP